MNEPSVFDTRTLKEIHEEIKQIYLSDRRPWIVGYSGGKDSTATLQLIWHALTELEPKDRLKAIYVISSDTLVETPAIVNFIDSTLDRINEAAKKQHMPFHAEKVKPITSDTFWVNLIGRGYPAPQTMFRWCTERMKIDPVNRFIVGKVSQYGEVVIVLGVRRSESITRAQVMSLHEIKGSTLYRHSKFSGALVYTPIKDFSLNDVWSYLLQTPSPWGNNNRDLLALYQSATAGECPLVIDETTPSCGNSRFGCWVCTVVKQDKTMEALINSGHEWMMPLLEIRNLLASTQDPSVKQQYRELKRRTGTIAFHRDGSGTIVPGPYKLEFCAEILKRVLKAEAEVKNNGPDPNIVLISSDELYEIRRIWRTERGDWADTVPKIYREVIGNDIPWASDDIGCFGISEMQLLDRICREKHLPLMLMVKLITAEFATQGMKRRSTIYPNIDKILREEWRSKEEILNFVKEKQLKLGGS